MKRADMTPEQLERRKASEKKWRERNRKALQRKTKRWFDNLPEGQRKAIEKRHREAVRDELRDYYIVARIIRGTVLTKEDIPPELISLKRAIITLKRLIKKQETGA